MQPLSSDVIGSLTASWHDVPCTCEGTARKSGGLHFRPIDPKFRAELAVRQRHCFDSGAGTGEGGGGVVVYSTCTFAPEENEAVLTDALTRFGSYKVLFEKIELPAVRFPLDCDNGMDKNFCQV